MEAIRGPANDFFALPQEVRHDYPRLLADIGGTNIRFALEQADGRFKAVSMHELTAFQSISDAIRSYLSQSHALFAGSRQVRHAAFAIATPIDGDLVQMTNAPWTFSIKALKDEFGFETLLLFNDFTALAMALPLLTSDQVCQVGGGKAKSKSSMGLLGAGSGLGVSGLIPTENGWVALASEGGHVSFSPASEREADILRFAWHEYPHVSAERLLSGMGLVLIYQAVAELAGLVQDKIGAPEISRRALAHECPVCEETLEHFCAMLGTVAANLALTLGAQGGIYIGGGIVPHLGDYFFQSGFRQRFENKGRFSAYLAAIPVYVITAENPTLYGVSTMLGKHLRG